MSSSPPGAVARYLTFPGATDQGSQLTSPAFTSVLKNNDHPIPMDGKVCWRDNVFVERLQKTTPTISCPKMRARF